MIKTNLTLIALFFWVLSLTCNLFAHVNVSDNTQMCIDCHLTVTPGIVADWEESLHSKTTLGRAMVQEILNRRISVSELPASIDNDIAIGCFECHSLNTENHKDSFDHFDFKINVVVSPHDCKTCHPIEVDQYTNSKKGFAHDNLVKNPLYMAMVETLTSTKEFKDGNITPINSSDVAKGETCLGCHGTFVGVEGMKTIESDLGEIEVPALTNWPNQGVGRINPDGSRGACTSCHSRHSFSIEVARKPYTCGQCHLEPDVPAYNVYKESKHGNLFSSQKEKWEWGNVPWVVGEDFQAPTCASCHNSLLIDSEGNVIAERSHDFGSRLWVRIFGLVYSHPQPISGATYEILNADKLPLPVSFAGEPASEFLITKDEQAARREKMGNVCKACHGTSWVESKFENFEITNSEADKMVAAATQLISEAWENKISNNTNPFDEYPEQLWTSEWLFYANSLRYGSAMMGQDYAAFKNGWWKLSENLQHLHEIIKLKSK